MSLVQVPTTATLISNYPLLHCLLVDYLYHCTRLYATAKTKQNPLSKQARLGCVLGCMHEPKVVPLDITVYHHHVAKHLTAMLCQLRHPALCGLANPIKSRKVDPCCSVVAAIKTLTHFRVNGSLPLYATSVAPVWMMFTAKIENIGTFNWFYTTKTLESSLNLSFFINVIIFTLKHFTLPVQTFPHSAT